MRVAWGGARNQTDREILKSLTELKARAEGYHETLCQDEAAHG